MGTSDLWVVFRRFWLIMGALLIIVCSIILLFLGSGWAEISRSELQGAFMPFVVLSLIGFVSGLLIITSEW